jgi:hypothetical protein
MKSKIRMKIKKNVTYFLKNKHRNEPRFIGFSGLGKDGKKMGMKTKKHPSRVLLLEFLLERYYAAIAATPMA